MTQMGLATLPAFIQERLLEDMRLSVQCSVGSVQQSLIWQETQAAGDMQLVVDGSLAPVLQQTLVGYVV